MACTGCLSGKIDYRNNQRFEEKGEPLIYAVVAILPFAYAHTAVFLSPPHLRPCRARAHRMRCVVCLIVAWRGVA
jgi:hypothetical protein